MIDKQFIGKVALKENIDDNSYLNDLVVIKYLKKNKFLNFTKSVTFFVGENGTGKSTLLEGIAVAFGFNPEGGTRNFNFSTNNNHSELYKSLTLSKYRLPKDGFFLRAESFYNAASYIEETYYGEFKSKQMTVYGDKSLHHQSHGESFMTLIQNRFRGNGVYLLDEPEAALSPSRLMALIIEINNLVEQGSQFIIATHSPILMAFPNAQIFEITDKGINSVDYKDTEHYIITQQFLNKPEHMLEQLLNPIE